MITVLDDPAAVARAAADRFVEAASAAIEANGRFVVVLAGGSTPRGMYGLLASPAYRERVDWSSTLLLFGDERCVPPDDAQSNYRMVRETLLEPLSIPGKNVIRIEAEREPALAATRYMLRMRDLFVGEVLPRFDLLLLGVGPDGHTASLFPGTAALDEQRRWVAANYVPQLDSSRITLTFTALNGSRRVLFLATGAEKAAVVAEAFGGVPHAPPYPCERVVPVDGTREILVDRAAGTNLPR